MTRSVIAGAAAALLLAATPAAAQARDPLAGGTTTLKLDTGVAKALTAAGVKGSGTRDKLPGGALAGAPGTIRHSGSLTLSAGATKLTLSAFTVKLGKTASLSG